MNRTQIYLSPEQQKALKAMAARTGRTQSELIRDAIDRFVGQRKASERASVLKRSAGLWKGRKDLPDFAALRGEALPTFAAGKGFPCGPDELKALAR